MTQRPLFLLSLPRSGSTLVQRVLAAHPEISTVSEPWLLLPQVYAMRDRGAYAEYNQAVAAQALRQFAAGLPGGQDDYWAEVRTFVLGLYRKASDGRGSFFLDKTPRYHLIVRDLVRIFPDAHYIFLWRNPLSVVASISETWGKGRWNVARWHVDLFDGIANLVAAFEDLKPTAFAVRFEDLVADPMIAWPRLFEHLGLAFRPELLTAPGSVRLEGPLGDPTGPQRYTELSTEPLGRWKRTLATPVRKRWCRRYLEWIGEKRLKVMGYDLEAMLGDLDALPTRLRPLASDLARLGYYSLDRTGRETGARLLWRKRPGAEGRDLDYGFRSKGHTSSP